MGETYPHGFKRFSEFLLLKPKVPLTGTLAFHPPIKPSFTQPRANEAFKQMSSICLNFSKFKKQAEQVNQACFLGRLGERGEEA